MFQIIFTSDYEIHGNGEGSPMKLMIDPTRRMMDFFDKYGARLTIMADVAEVICFKEHLAQFCADDFFYTEIAEQLKYAVSNRHDVQLHLHPSYFRAKYSDGCWRQYYKEYDIASLGYERINEIVKISVKFLETLLHEVKPDYKCIAFRAANWSMQPSGNIIKALIDNGIKYDTSVFKNGYCNGLVNFDYTKAISNIIPWKVGKDDICRMDPDGELVEIPIYSEDRFLFSFLSINRVLNIINIANMKHYDNMLDEKSDKKYEKNISLINKFKSRFIQLFKRHAWKMDFNQCTGKQLVKTLKKIRKNYGYLNFDLPVLLIGHSKIFTQSNERSLSYFLQFVKDNPDDFSFSVFSDLKIENIPVNAQG